MLIIGAFLAGLISIIYLVAIVIELDTKGRILESRVENLEKTNELLVNKVSNIKDTVEISANFEEKK